MNPDRRTQRQRSHNTREALLAAGRQLFTERGYSAVSANEIVAAAGLTRGALYHHYAGKHDLFRDVMERVESELADEIRAVIDAEPDLLTGALAGLRAFLDACPRPEVHQIALTDAPAVLGWSTWREIESAHGLGVIIDVLDRAAAAGLIAVPRVSVLAQLIMSALIEAALLIANAEDKARAREEADSALGTLLAGVLATNG